MTKLEQLQQAIDAIPPEYRGIWSRMTYLLEQGQFSALFAYAEGTRAMALHLTSDEALLKPLSDIQEILK